MAFEYHYRRRIEFSDTDLAGIVHFANYYRIMEAAEHAFLRSLGVSVHAEIDGRLVSWPRVKAECEFLAPIAFEDEVDVHVLVREKKRKSITYGFRFTRSDGTLAARGSVTAVCVAIDPATRNMRSITIPDAIGSKLDVAPPDALA